MRELFIVTIAKHIIRKEETSEITTKQMKYKQEYLSTKSKEEFINLLLNRYSHLKRTTAFRRFYDLKKIYGTQEQIKIIREPIYDSEEKSKPGIMRMMLFNDIKKYRIKITREYLRKYGFTPIEINWLIDEGEQIEKGRGW